MQGTAEEKRVNYILQNYWNALRGDRPYPSEQEIDPDALAEIWDSVFLIQVKPQLHASGFRYSYMGKSLIDAYGDNFTGRDVHEALLETSRDPIIEDIVTVIESGKPTVHEAEFENVHRHCIKFRRIVCPLGPTEKTVDFLIGAMRWKVE